MKYCTSKITKLCNGNRLQYNHAVERVNTAARSWKNSLDRSGYTILYWVFEFSF